ncbi:MAG: element excision factor XisH family protein [Microcystis panniformis]|nr:hypothetical protein [Microcystis aeruginosa F13-15]
MKYKDVELFADLAAEKPLAAERNRRKIVVEIKSFLIRVTHRKRVSRRNPFSTHALMQKGE